MSFAFVIVKRVPLALEIQSITIDYNMVKLYIDYNKCSSNIPSSLDMSSTAICSSEIYNSRLKYITTMLYHRSQ